MPHSVHSSSPLSSSASPSEPGSIGRTFAGSPVLEGASETYNDDPSGSTSVLTSPRASTAAHAANVHEVPHRSDPTPNSPLPAVARGRLPIHEQDYGDVVAAAGMSAYTSDHNTNRVGPNMHLSVRTQHRSVSIDPGFDTDEVRRDARRSFPPDRYYNSSNESSPSPTPSEISCVEMAPASAQRPRPLTEPGTDANLADASNALGTLHPLDTRLQSNGFTPTSTTSTSSSSPSPVEPKTRSSPGERKSRNTSEVERSYPLTFALRPASGTYEPSSTSTRSQGDNLDFSRIPTLSAPSDRRSQHFGIGPSAGTTSPSMLSSAPTSPPVSLASTREEAPPAPPPSRQAPEGAYRPISPRQNPQNDSHIEAAVLYPPSRPVDPPALRDRLANINQDSGAAGLPSAEISPHRPIVGCSIATRTPSPASVPADGESPDAAPEEIHATSPGQACFSRPPVGERRYFTEHTDEEVARMLRGSSGEFSIVRKRERTLPTSSSNGESSKAAIERARVTSLPLQIKPSSPPRPDRRFWVTHTQEEVDDMLRVSSGEVPLNRVGPRPLAPRPRTPPPMRRRRGSPTADVGQKRPHPSIHARQIYHHRSVQGSADSSSSLLPNPNRRMFMDLPPPVGPLSTEDVYNMQLNVESDRRSLSGGSLRTFDGNSSLGSGSLPVARGSTPLAHGSIPIADGSPDVQANEAGERDGGRGRDSRPRSPPRQPRRSWSPRSESEYSQESPADAEHTFITVAEGIAPLSGTSSEQLSRTTSSFFATTECSSISTAPDECALAEDSQDTRPIRRLTNVERNTALSSVENIIRARGYSDTVAPQSATGMSTQDQHSFRTLPNFQGRDPFTDRAPIALRGVRHPLSGPRPSTDSSSSASSASGLVFVGLERLENTARDGEGGRSVSPSKRKRGVETGDGVEEREASPSKRK